MSTITTGTPVRRGPVDLTARWFLRAQLRRGEVVLDHRASSPSALGDRDLRRPADDQVTTSVVAYGRQALMWVPFSVFIGLRLVYLPVARRVRAHPSVAVARLADRGAADASCCTAAGTRSSSSPSVRCTYALSGGSGGSADDVSCTIGSRARTSWRPSSRTLVPRRHVRVGTAGRVRLPAAGGGWWGTLTLPADRRPGRGARSCWCRTGTFPCAGPAPGQRPRLVARGRWPSSTTCSSAAPAVPTKTVGLTPPRVRGWPGCLISAPGPLASVS